MIHIRLWCHSFKAIYFSLGLLLYSCFLNSATASVPTTTELSPCYLKGFAQSLRCGSLVVAEDPQQAQGETIEIHFVILPAIKNTTPEQATLAIAGGPGQSAIDNALQFQRMLQGVRQYQDIVLIDQRGTGRSAPLVCQGDEETWTLNEANQEIAALTKTCLAEQTQAVQHFTTTNAVHDIDAVRQALGYEQFNVYGISYGTRVAQVLARLYPQSVATLTLDGVVPMQVDLSLLGVEVEQALQRLFVDCQQQLSCQQQYPQLESQLMHLVKTLKAQPIETRFDHPRTAQNTPLLLTQEKLLSTIRLALYSPLTRRLLPLTIAQAAAGNYKPLLGLYSLTMDGLSMAMGMHASVICSEDIPFMTPLPADEQGLFARPMQQQLQSLCQAWPASPVSADFHQPLATDIPTLLLSGALDPATPPHWGEQAMIAMTQAKHLIAPQAAHGVLGQTCAPKIVADFIQQGHWQEIDVQCIFEEGARHFLLNANSATPQQSSQEVSHD